MFQRQHELARGNSCGDRISPPLVFGSGSLSHGDERSSEGWLECMVDAGETTSYGVFNGERGVRLGVDSFEVESECFLRYEVSLIESVGCSR